MTKETKEKTKTQKVSYANMPGMRDKNARCICTIGYAPELKITLMEYKIF
jgi:hypothetical protein